MKFFNRPTKFSKNTSLESIASGIIFQKKTQFLLLSLALAIGCTVSQGIAQSISVQSIQLGPKAGVNISHWGGDDFGTKSKAGWHIGGFAHLQFSKRYELQTELLYSVTGAKREKTCSCSSNFTLPYLSLPILATYRVTPELYFNFGPQIGILLNAKDEDGSQLKDEFKNTDLALAFGLGYQLPKSIHLQVRYVAGISNFNNEEMFDEHSSNQIFQISAGYVLWKKDFNQ